MPPHEFELDNLSSLITGKGPPMGKYGNAVPDNVWLQGLIKAILLLLSDPAADSPLNCDAGNMVRGGDMMAYNSMAKMYSIEFARKVES